MLKKVIISSLIYFLFSNCGFKIVNQSNLNNFDIAEIITSGDKKINFRIKNKLVFNSKKNNSTLISLSLNTKKIKSIKEKNIKNEITKHKLEIVTQVEVKNITTKKINNFKVIEIGEFSVADQYSQTLNNEKKVLNLLSDKIADRILDEINFRPDDF